MKKSLLFVIGFIAFVILGYFYFKYSQKPKTLKIGFVGALTGSLSSYGIPEKKAIQLAVKHINEQGGVKFRNKNKELKQMNIELISEDDMCQSNQAIAAVSKLLSTHKDIVAVIGHTCSGSNQATFPQYMSINMPVISPSATRPEFTTSGKYPIFFRTIAHDGEQSAFQCKFIIDKLNVKSAMIIHDKSAYGSGLANSSYDCLVKEKVEIKENETIGITPGAPSYDSLIDKIANIKPDIVVFGGYHPEAAKLLRGMSNKKLKINFLSGDGIRDPSFLKVAQKSAIGIYVSAPKKWDDNTRAKKFIEDYKKEYKQDIGNFSLQSYTAVELLVKAIERSDSIKHKDLIYSLKNLPPTNTVIGKVHFDKKGDVVGAGYIMTQVQEINGKLKFIEL